MSALLKKKEAWCIPCKRMQKSGHEYKLRKGVVHIMHCQQSIPRSDLIWIYVVAAVEVMIDDARGSISRTTSSRSKLLHYSGAKFACPLKCDPYSLPPFFMHHHFSLYHQQQSLVTLSFGICLRLYATLYPKWRRRQQKKSWHPKKKRC